MTLIEVMIALVILSGALVLLAGFMARFAHSIGETQARTTANQLAAERLEFARQAGLYTNVDTIATTENPVAGYPGFTRQTVVTRVGGGTSDTLDYKIVTAIVSASGLTTPVRKTTIIAVY